MKYIDADTLRAGIESICLFPQKSADYNDGREDMKMMVFDLIDSLQQEQPEVFDSVAFQKGVQEGRKLERDEPVTECHDLTEAADKFARFYDNGTCDGIAQDCFIAGAKLQKRKMMEGAVEGYVNYYEDSGGILMAEAQVGYPYHNGDKVKIIIVKEEE